jgi:hypothetical protein
VLQGIYGFLAVANLVRKGLDVALAVLLSADVLVGRSRGLPVGQNSTVTPPSLVAQLLHSPNSAKRYLSISSSTLSLKADISGISTMFSFGCKSRASMP